MVSEQTRKLVIKGNEYLIVRPDNFGVEKIVTYGVNDY